MADIREEDKWGEINESFRESMLYYKQFSRNDLVRMTYKMSANHFKLMTYILSFINPSKSLDVQNPVIIKTDDLRKLLGWKATTRWTHLRTELLSMRKEVNIFAPIEEGSKDYVDAFVFPKVIWRQGGMLEVYIEKWIEPYIANFNHNTRYTMLKPDELTQMKTFKAMRLYHVLVSWLDPKTAIRMTPQYIDLETLKSIMQTENYSFREFNRRILKPAVDEINENTDLYVEFERVTGWKNTTLGIKFTYGNKNIFTGTKSKQLNMSDDLF